VLPKTFQLNPEQKKAVTHPAGPLLIIAGAGTGKTAVVTERIKWLIEKKNVKPSEILALTFTEKAAAEMEERVDVALPMGYVQTWISTFHSFCEQILRLEAVHLGLDPAFRILSEAESYLFVKKNLFQFPLDYYRPLGNPTKFISGMLTHFSRLRDENISSEEYLEFVKHTGEVGKKQEKTGSPKHTLELALAYQKYQELKVKEGMMDFADLLFYTFKLFNDRPNILAKYQKQFKHVLLDEFQDTNYIQNEIALLLAGDDQNITAVCDDDQSIYRWRGAAVYNVLDFKEHYPKTTVVSLIKNYRSPQVILDRAYEFIQHNNPDRLEVKEKIDKKLHSTVNPAGSDIKLIWEEKVEDTAEIIISEIKRLVENDERHYQDFAILVRANNHAYPFLQALERASLPYQFLGPGQLYHQPEIKDLIAYFKLLYDPQDDIAVYRLLTKDYFGFNRRDMSFLISHARRKNLSLFETLEKLEGIKVLNKITYRKAKKLVKILHRHFKLIPKESPGQLLYYFLENTNLLKFYSDPKSPQHQREIRNISRFFNKIKSFEAQNPESNLYDFVEYLDFVINQGESPLASEVDWVDNNAVNILTFHSAKGLEFPVVFMVNLVNDRFPTRRRADMLPLPDEIIKEPLPSADPHLQEERRLFYVGMTRAKERLYFTGAKFYHDNKRPKRLSIFVTETLGENLENFLLRQDEAHQTSLFGWTPVSATPPVPPSEEHISKTDYLSYSRLNTFNNCPRQYQYQYDLCLPQPPASALSFGDSMHQSLAEFYRRRVSNQKVDLETLQELLETLWISGGYGSKEHEQKQKKAGLEMLKSYFQKAYFPDQEILKIEFPFKIRLDEVSIGGRIDRVDRLPDGGLEIIDYKTGKSKTQKDADKDLQMSIYALAAKQKHILDVPLEKLKLSFYFLEEGEKVSTTRTEDDLINIKGEIKEVLDEINTGQFIPTPGFMCGYCSYQLLCPAYKGKV